MTTTATTDAIIVGAGSGSRLGYSTPKAFVDLCGKPLFYYSLKMFVAHPSINKTIFVAPPSMVDEATNIINRHDEFIGKVRIVPGGAERYESVQSGIAPSDAEWILIHDAARPFVTARVIDDVLDMREIYECAITATPEVDTIREIASDNRCGATLDRSKLMRVGTPQMFKRQALLSAFDQIKNMVTPPTDEAALFENLGIAIGYSWGDPINFKITTDADMKMAEALIWKRT